MPTYVYRFVDSGETLEVQQSFSDEPLTEAVHPVTGELAPVRKVFTPVGITFKGSGFYKTDSRSGSSKRSGSSGSGSSSEAKATEAASSDSTATAKPADTSSSSSSSSPAPSGSSSSAT